MDLSGHPILIVESEGVFTEALRVALEQAGAETLAARDTATALWSTKTFRFSAAAINREHSALLDALRVPTIVYGAQEVPQQHDAIVSAPTRLVPSCC